MTVPGSLRLRLMAGGVLAIALALVLAGLGLTVLFERHVLRQLADSLEVDLNQVLTSIEIDASGQPVLSKEPSDPRFQEPLSGLYWQLGSPTAVLKRSRSLWDGEIGVPSDVPAMGEVHRHRVAGPGGSQLLAVERTVSLRAAEWAGPFRLAVAADLKNIAEARRAFAGDLVPSLALLGIALVAAAWAQIWLGLRPLLSVRDGISAIRAGRADQIEARVPSEIAPLVTEINDLVAAQERDIARARGRAADLAHGLKTPLSALSADVETLRARGETEIAQRIDDVGSTMKRHIERELARARIRGTRGFTTPAVTPVRPLVDTLVSIQTRAPGGDRLHFEVSIPDAAEIAIDRTDLAEVLGNLIENAARHAKRVIRIVWAEAAGATLAVEDDGPGLPPELSAWVVERGRRLDQRPGSAGLGLAIVEDVLEAYDRRLTLSASTLGGLRASF